VRHFFASVAGESYPNDDGSDRQTPIASCRVDEPLILDAEPDNPEDENAIRVLRLDGKQISYIERDMAARLVEEPDRLQRLRGGRRSGRGAGIPRCLTADRCERRAGRHDREQLRTQRTRSRG
jgi:HIRAN domain